MAKRQANPRITVDILPMETDAVADEDSDGDSAAFEDDHCRRNLLEDFLTSKRSLEPPPPNEHMKVYLRVRPFSEDELKSGSSQSCLTVDNDRTVSTVPPKDSHYYKATTRGLCKTSMKYTFSRIFGEATTQKEFFKDVMLGLVKDFIDGQNCLVFSYGVTSSGKTYTIQGNPKDAGILPRTLDVLFNSIGGQQWDQMNLKPKMFNGVARLSGDQESLERKAKQKVLKLCCEDDMDVMSLLGDDASDMSVATNTTVNTTINTTTCSESSNVSTINGKDLLGSTEKLFEDLDDRIREEAMVNVADQGAIRFSVWVSFAEIYNEQIFDLLAPMPKKKNERRVVLKLSEDQNGCPYIKGLKEINVTSADEAFKLLTIGQRNLRTACTKLNHSSSRGHCIFNMKIIRVHDKDNPHLARVSRLSMCDLAGSERYSKTQSAGDRLKEAGNINTSLLTLGRCIETLRHNQHHKDNPRIIPFRESKLTRLFQNFFSGQGKAAMVVNVNQCSSMFDETQHVFKFSAIASQVVVPPKPIFVKPKLPVIVALPNPIPRATSICWATPCPTSKANQQVAENVPLPEGDEDDLEDDLEEQIYTQDNIDELLEVIEQLQAELAKEVAAKLKEESRIRNQVCDEMKQQFTEIEEAYSEQIRVREQMAEDLAEKRIQIMMEAERAKRERTNMMKDSEDEWVSSLLLHQEKVKLEERNTTIKTLKSDVATLKTQVADLTKSQEKSDKENANLQKQLTDAHTEIDRLKQQLAASLESTSRQESELSKAAKDKTNLDVLQKQISDYEGKITQLELDLVQIQNEKPESDAAGKADVVENLTQQLQQSRQHIKEQERETSELNDMLTEAGETFEQREGELQKLTDLAQEYEKRMEEQAEAIKVLERAAADSRVAMETADQSLSKREDCVTTLQSEIRDLEGSNPECEHVPESPMIPLFSPQVSIASTLDRFRHSVSQLDFSATTEHELKDSAQKEGDYHTDSSGIVLDDTGDFSDSYSSMDVKLRNNINGLDTVPRTTTTMTSECSKNRIRESDQRRSMLGYVSDSSEIIQNSPDISPQKDTILSNDFNFGRFRNCSDTHSRDVHVQISKPLNDSRVLQVMLTPLASSLVVKHTKSSMLRLKNSPVKDPTRGRICMKGKQLARKSLLLDKENVISVKRKCENADVEFNTIKRRKVAQPTIKKVVGKRKSKLVSVSRVGQRYNLRSQH